VVLGWALAHCASDTESTSVVADSGTSGDASTSPDADATATDAPVENSVPNDVALDVVADQELVPPLHVLFVGNSYTYENDLPGLLATIPLTSGVPPAIAVESETLGGASFSVHWSGPTAQAKIANGGFTHVVLQGQSGEPLVYTAAFLEYGKLLVSAVVAAGATPVLFQTWAHRPDDAAFYQDAVWAEGSADAMQDALTAHYAQLAAESGAVVAPVGEAWRRAWKQHPGIQLYQSDGSHPSAAGSYLTACVFYVVLTGESVPASSAVPASISATDAAALREVANEEVSGP
jgi:hypothetical protein